MKKHRRFNRYLGVKLKAKAKVKTKIKYDDNASSSSSSSEFFLQTSFTETEIEELENQLSALGFDGGMALIVKYGHERVKQAMDRALSRPPGAIRNVPGYIRHLVTTGGKIPPPNGNLIEKEWSERQKRALEENAERIKAKKGGVK